MLAAQAQLQRSPQAGSTICAGPRVARRQAGRRCRRRAPRPAAALGVQQLALQPLLRPLQLEGPLLGLLELVGYTGDDPAHWNFSPE